jgi:hypothetical protein
MDMNDMKEGQLAGVSQYVYTYTVGVVGAV